MARRGRDEDEAIYVISVAAQLAGVHPQTLRVYERKGLLSPQRTAGNTRRYSDRDIARLRRILELSQEGINLAGVVRVMELEEELERAKKSRRVALDELGRVEARLEEAMTSGIGASLVPFKDVRRVRRAMKSDELEQAARPRVFQAPPVSKTWPDVDR